MIRQRLWCAVRRRWMAACRGARLTAGPRAGSDRHAEKRHRPRPASVAHLRLRGEVRRFHRGPGRAEHEPVEHQHAHRQPGEAPRLPALRARQGRFPTDRQGSPGAGGFANDVRRHRPVSRPGAGVVRTFGRGAVPGPRGQSRDLAPGPFRRCAGALPAARPGCPTEPFRQFAHRAGTGGDRRRAGPGDLLFQPFAAEPRIPPAVSRRDRRVLRRSPSAVRRGAADPGADRRL